jgi:HK97 family phage major capsid protein
VKYLEILRAKLAELTEQRNAAITEAEAIAETLGDDTDDETRTAAISEADVALERATKLAEPIAELERKISDLETTIERASAAKDAPQIIRKVEVDPSPEVRSLSRGQARDQALALLESRSGDVDTRNGDRLDQLVRSERTSNLDGDQIARRMLITEAPEYRSAWMKLVTGSQPILSPDEARAVEAYTEFRAMSVGTTTAGGFGVPVLIDPTIILTAQGALNPIESISRVETITTNAWKGVSSAGVSWSFDVEAAAVSDDSPTLAQPSVSVHMARGFIPYSIEVGQDYPGFASEMSTLLGEGWNELKAQKFAVGSGTNEPWGIFTALDANTNVEVVVTSDGVFQGADINKVWGAVPDRFKANSTWLMSHDVANEVAVFGNGNNLSFVTVDLTGSISTIRERPVAFASYAPEFTGVTTAANVLVVGDFRNYLIAQRAGMEVELVPHLFDVTNNRPTGERGWFAHARVGADSINDLGFRLLQNQ